MSDELFQILLVEDNLPDVYLFKKALALAELKFDLVVLSDGAEALSFARRQGPYSQTAIPDLAVMDLNLPKNGGAEVLQAFRENKLFANVPVVITSSSGSPRDRANVERLGIQCYLTKPPDLDGFLQIGGILKQILLETRASR